MSAHHAIAAKTWCRCRGYRSLASLTVESTRCALTVPVHGNDLRCVDLRMLSTEASAASDTVDCLPVIHRHRETDADAGEAGKQPLVGCSAGESTEVVEQDDDNADRHQTEHHGNVPGRRGTLFYDRRRLVRRRSWAFGGLFATF